MIASALSFLAGLLLVQQFSTLPDSLWLIAGGILAGIAGVFTAAAVSVELENRKDSRCNAEEELKRLALPESEGR